MIWISDNNFGLIINWPFLKQSLRMSEKKLKIIENIINEASKTKKNVLISGEVGSGEEYTARSIHNSSIRKDKEFVVVNITTILSVDKILKYISKANGGTLYLDEIGNLDLKEQEKLLEIIEKGKINSSLSSLEKDIDIRIIASTKKNILEEIHKRLFNKDLYNILSQFTIELFPLREMGEEIIELAEFFILEYCKKNRKPLKQLSHGAKEILLNYDYPQNHRELKAIMELSLMMANNSIIYPEEIYLRKNMCKVDILREERTLEQYDKMIIEHFLTKYDNRVYYVAEKLGISKNKIYNMINKGIIKKS